MPITQYVVFSVLSTKIWMCHYRSVNLITDKTLHKTFSNHWNENNMKVVFMSGQDGGEEGGGDDVVDTAGEYQNFDD